MKVAQIQTERAQIVEVIRTVHVYGKGTGDDPTRVEAWYWTKTGDFLVKFDINDDPMSAVYQAPSDVRSKLVPEGEVEGQVIPSGIIH